MFSELDPARMDCGGGVRELDLRHCGPGSVADRVGVVLGLRSSAAFFSCLRANLVMSPSVLSSNHSTPYLEAYSPRTKPATSSRHSARSLPAPPAAQDPLLPLEHDIPPLSLDMLQSQDEKAEGLGLVAASVSEMRPRAIRAVLLHPLCLAGILFFWATTYRLAQVWDSSACTRAIQLAAGITMLGLAAVCFAGAAYSRIARDWAQSAAGEEDVVLGARVGGVLVGALVLRLEYTKAPATSSSPHHRRKGRSPSATLKGGQGVIRAWATASPHRRQGIGRQLLTEAVRHTRDCCGKDAQVGFAQQHANSVMVMPALFNTCFRRDEVRAAKALASVVTEWDGNKRKKR